MYVLMTYDVEAKRTEKFKKLMRRYLEHVQFSVFSGDLSEAKLMELRRAVSRLLQAWGTRDRGGRGEQKECAGGKFRAQRKRQGRSKAHRGQHSCQRL